jgi:hypothetical protein
METCTHPAEAPEPRQRVGRTPLSTAVDGLPSHSQRPHCPTKTRQDKDYLETLQEFHDGFRAMVGGLGL